MSITINERLVSDSRIIYNCKSELCILTTIYSTGRDTGEDNWSRIESQ